MDERRQGSRRTIQQRRSCSVGSAVTRDGRATTASVPRSVRPRRVSQLGSELRAVCRHGRDRRSRRALWTPAHDRGPTPLMCCIECCIDAGAARSTRAARGALGAAPSLGVARAHAISGSIAFGARSRRGLGSGAICACGHRDCSEKDRRLVRIDTRAARSAALSMASIGATGFARPKGLWFGSGLSNVVRRPHEDAVA